MPTSLLTFSPADARAHRQAKTAPARRHPGRSAAWWTASLLSLLALPASAGTVEVQVLDGAGKPLAGAAVFAESREAKAAVKPVNTLEVVQANRQFQQLVTLVPVGSAVTFPNRDTVRHHLYSFSPVKKFEIKLYVGTPAAPVVFDQAGIAALGCNIHDQMAAWLVVVETPYHGLTGADGKLSLPRVPAGHYRLRTWHPGMAPGAPALDQALTVAVDSTAVQVKVSGLAP